MQNFLIECYINSDIDETLRSMHQSFMTKMKNSISKDWIAETNIEHCIKVFKI